MMLGSRTAAWAKSGYTAKDYVQNGLVFQFDGIDNVGYGVHSDSITSPIDLTGNSVEYSHTGTLYAGVNFLHFDSSSDIYFSNDFVRDSDGRLTIEAYFEGDNKANSNMAFFMYAKNVVLSRTVMEIGSSYKRYYLGRVGTISNPYSPIVFSCQNSSSPSGDDFYIRGKRYDGDFSISWEFSRVDYIRLRSANSASGKLYYMRVYNRPLNAAEVAANYAIDKARFNIPDAA